MTDLKQELRCRREYGMRSTSDGKSSILFSDQEVTLSQQALDAYRSLAARMFRRDIASKTPAADEKLLKTLQSNRLLYSVNDLPESVTGQEFYDRHFAPVLTAWLHKAFSHKFWDVMMRGDGSVRMYAGWLFELYHYTKNANRHMPLAAATCTNKRVKLLLAKHYEEEWNHFHFFSRALVAMGFTKEQVRDSKPLPMTMEMSNFMRQAARRDSLAYAICSAVLEGTTVDHKAFNPFYEAVKTHYGVPNAAVQPIYDHLDLDVKYGHSNLFLDICVIVPQMDAERAATVLGYGHQMVEHIWMWTESIASYYGNQDNALPHRRFDIRRD